MEVLRGEEVENAVNQVELTGTEDDTMLSACSDRELPSAVESLCVFVIFPWPEDGVRSRSESSPINGRAPLLMLCLILYGRNLNISRDYVS